MSRTYDALLKAQREKSGHKRITIPSEPVPEAQTSETKVEAQQEIPPPNGSLRVPPQKAPVRSLSERERLRSSVAVGRLVAKPNSLMAEQFRKLRSVITTHGLANSLRSVLITSCMPGEGKTTVTLNLSSAIAQGLDESVILIDADLRRLNLTSLLGLQNVPGLLDILEERVSIEETLVPTEIEGLTIIPGGVNPANPAEMVGSTRMGTLIRRLREEYRNSYIMIDSTPIVSTSESHVLSQMVDGVILVILADETRRDVVKRELNLINQQKILGVVLNCAEFETSGYYGKHYQQYYSKKKG